MHELSGVRVLVTGAGGFIGRATVRSLVAAGAHVRAHLGPAGDPFAAAPAGVETACADILDRAALAPLFEGMDQVVHLAGPPSVAESFESPELAVARHAAGTALVGDLSRRLGVSHVVYASSAEVYGRVAGGAAVEDVLEEPRSPYGAAKLCGEHVLAGYQRSFGLRSTSLRLFSTYGSGMSERSLLCAIVRQAASSRQIVVESTTPRRDFIHVSDVSGAILAACRRPASTSRVVNVGSGAATSVGELIAAVGRVLRRPLEPAPSRANRSRPESADIALLVADMSRAREALRWQPALTLHEGLIRMLPVRDANQSPKAGHRT